MWSKVMWAFCLLPTIYYLNCARCLWKNIAVARNTGIPYVIVPRFYYNTLAGIALRYPMRLLNFLDPESNHGPESWRHLQKAIWPWNLRYAPFKKLGVDSFLVVSPGGLVLMSADADVISQITARHNDFPKETQIYKTINIYGGNIMSAEGAEWKQHRKATAISFTEKTNKLVWTETLEQTSQMLAHWSARDLEQPKKTILTGAADTMRLSLHVMSRAGLGCKSEWFEDTNTTNDTHTTGHSMRFTDCLSSLLRDILFVLIIPSWILRNIPVRRMRRIFEVYIEFGKYMHEMMLSKRCEIENDPEDAISHTDVISQLVKGSSPRNASRAASTLTDSEVVGNLFVFIVAGHETSANSIHFALILLALNPKIQRKVQEELDTIFGDRSPEAWSYETDLPRLSASLLQAVLNEQLRMIPPTITIPKMVARSPQPLEVDGKQRILPQGTRIRLCIPSVHRNPRYWPTGPPRHPSNEFHSPCDPSNDLEEFKPERWLVGEQRTKTSPPASPSRYNTRSKSKSPPPSRGKPDSSTGPHTLFSPRRGSYIPFSLDSRACLGKRFATVEILAALAAILSTHSIELSVEETASTADIEKMDVEEKRKVWEKARDEGNRTWQSKASMIMTLALRGDARVPFTVVKRGEEVFGPDVLREE